MVIKIWDIEKTWLITSLEGHTGNIKSLINLRKGYLASALWDTKIKVWNWENLEYRTSLLARLKGHSYEFVFTQK